MTKCPHNRIDHNLECLDCDEPIYGDYFDVEVKPYEDMTREELIECCKAHDAHHQEHHKNDEMMQKMADALNGFTKFYGHLWDSADVEGAGWLSPESVIKYDHAHQIASETLEEYRKSKGE